MTETGRVREVKGNLVIIAPDRSAACFGCMNHECKSGGGFLTAENPLGLLVEAGQTVEARAAGFSLLVQALAVFLPPVLSFSAGFILTRLLFPAAGEAAAAFAALGFLLTAAFITYRTRKTRPAAKEFIVTKILA